MEKEILKQGIDLITELENLEGYRDIAKNGNGAVHFEIRKHYLECEEYERIVIATRYNDRLFKVIEEIIKEIDKQRLALEDEVYKCDSIKVNYKINFLIGLLLSKGSRFKSGNITIDFEKQTEENAEINPIVKHGEYIEITWCHQKYGGKKSEYFKVGAIFKVVWMRGCEETGRIICKLANPYKKGYLYMNSNNYNWKKYKNEN